MLESVAAGLSTGIQANNRRLNAMSRMLRWVGWMLIGAPVLGAAAYEAIPSLIAWSKVVFQRFRQVPVLPEMLEAKDV